MHSGAWGLRVCTPDVAQPLATVRNRSQPSATVRNRLAAKFGGFKRRVASFRVAGVVLCDIPTCFKMCRKAFCVTGAILSRRFQKMRYIFRGRRSTLVTSVVILHGRRNTLDVLYCVFFANRIVRAASSGDNVQILWQAWHFVTCDEK